MQGFRIFFRRCSAGVAAVLAAAALSGSAPVAQEYTGTIVVTVTADRPNWTYEVGAPVMFRITVTRDGSPLAATVDYAVGPDGFPRGFPAIIEASATVPAGGLVVQGGTMAQPGFLRCMAKVEIHGKTYRGMATAAFSPEKIAPTVSDPPDFDAFWTAGKAALAKVPVEARLTPLPASSTAKADVYQVELTSISVEPETRSKVYGVLCEPKTGDRLPALLYVPGAGMRPYAGAIDLCEKGIITFQIGIHGIPVTFDQALYSELGNGALRNYYFYNLDDRDRYYYRRVYLGCVRANDFLASRPRWDGTNLAVNGGSQGGALSIVTAALDPRVKGLAASYPALADMTGYLKGRAGGWPHMFRADKKGVHETPQKLATVPFYDVVNFAKRLRVPGIYTWGFNDETVPPTSMFAAYNTITAPKRLLLALETGHGRTPEQESTMNAWLEMLLQGKPPAMTSTEAARP
jgi:cephalosporin-C deacetylase-like acetyl esterase